MALKPGETVLFQGTGGVSILGLIFASKAGAKVRLLSHECIGAKGLMLRETDYHYVEFG